MKSKISKFQIHAHRHSLFGYEHIPNALDRGERTEENEREWKKGQTTASQTESYLCIGYAVLYWPA